LSVRLLVLPADAWAASACGTGRKRLAPSRFPSELTAPQRARRHAPDGYSPLEAAALEQAPRLAGIGANPHRRSGDTMNAAVDRRPASKDEIRR
jgi:hypothetical protein